MALFHDSAIVGASGNQGGGGYEIERSLRFNSSDSAYLSRTPASAGNRKTWTLSWWMKLSALNNNDPSLFAVYTDGNNRSGIFLDTSANYQLGFYSRVGGTSQLVVITDAVLRDHSAWYHCVISVDTTAATASDRAKIYINGVEQSLSTSTYPSQNYDTYWNLSSEHNVGRYGGATQFYDGLLADVFLIDGQALDPSSFGEFDTNGVWQPIDASGLTYGTNGFHLPFSDNSTAAALGTDTSGNGNTWTVNNLSVTSGGPTSVTAASGALPIYNTTDTYGTTKGTGTRTDSNSSSIVLALPMDGANNGTTFADESATIKGSGSAKTLTRNGDTKTVTSQSKFYGSSCAFDGTGDFLSHAANTDFQFGTGNLTVELWVYFNSLPGFGVAGLVDTGTSVNANRFSVVVYPNGAVYVDSNANLVAGTAGKITAGKWIHIAVCRAGTGSNQTTLYIDGVADKTATVSTNFSNSNLRIGVTVDNLYLNGFIQDLRIYKGAAKYTSNFNPPSSTQNPTIAAGIDSLVDTPTSVSATDTGIGGEIRGNYATFNPIGTVRPITGIIPTLTNGNLDAAHSGGSWQYANSTIAVPAGSGKYYCEFYISSSYAPDYIAIGVNPTTAANFNATVHSSSQSGIFYSNNGEKWVTNSNSAYGSAYTTGDLIGVALNCDSGQVTFYKNNTSQGAISFNSNLTNGGTIYFTIDIHTSNLVANFGQRPFAYTAPSGFKALCTTNLPAPVVAKPNEVMDVVTYTGNGSTQTISGLNFSPDLVWIKARNLGYWHRLIDSVRGAQKFLYSNVTDAEGTSTANDIFTSFDSTGFTLGGADPSADGLNQNAQPYVAWTWDAGSSTVTNNAGSIESQVRANASAGFSVVTYPGALSGAGSSTIGHGLGVAPSLIIVKNRDAAENWVVYHQSLGNSAYVILNSTNARVAGSSLWGTTSPTSSLFTAGYSSQANLSGNNYVAYCFAPVAGYSSFGRYIGNGSTNGQFVYTGFRSRWVMVKCSSAGSTNWVILDSARDPRNPEGQLLRANLSGAEVTFSPYIDALSNGFKVRTTDAGINNSGATYIYAAFAESPFQYARAR